MTEFERAVLTVLARAREPVGWYHIERRLSNVTLARRPDLLEVLAELRDRGLVQQMAAASEPAVRYELTVAGAAALEE